MSTKSIPKIIHQIWYQGEEALPEKYIVWRQSIIQNNRVLPLTVRDYCN